MNTDPASHNTPQTAPPRWPHVLASEGFRLFFALAALYAAFWPLMWVLALGYNLPLARTVPASLWHAHEMLVGAFGAALIGFITTAAPEWTDTRPPHGRTLWAFAALWGTGRIVGLLGWDGMGALGALADMAWLTGLIIFLAHLSLQRRTDRLLPFIFWLLLLLGCLTASRIAFLRGDVFTATTALHLYGITFLGLLALALARITVPVTNLVLDPSEKTSPFRPHPGRINLASGLIVVVIAGDIWGLSPAVSGYLYIAAGAAFIDRVAEGFIGKQILRAEILMLAGSSALAGSGLILIGTARLGAPWAQASGLHLALMGGLGLGVLTVFCIAGLIHSGHPLGLSLKAKASALALVVSVLVRVLPELTSASIFPWYYIEAASLLWAASFLLWLWDFGPKLIDPETCGTQC